VVDLLNNFPDECHLALPLNLRELIPSSYVINTLSNNAPQASAKVPISAIQTFSTGVIPILPYDNGQGDDGVLLRSAQAPTNLGCAERAI